jgi:hypothetical protein
MGKSHLKPAKSQGQTRLAQTRTRGMAHAAVAPAAHRGGPLKEPLEQAPPRSRAHTSLKRAPPHSRAHAYLERAPPRSRVHAALEQAPPRSRALCTRTPVPIRGYGHLMLRQRRGGTIMRLGLTPRSCCTNSLGGNPSPPLWGTVRRGRCQPRDAAPPTPVRLTRRALEGGPAAPSICFLVTLQG